MSFVDKNGREYEFKTVSNKLSLVVTFPYEDKYYGQAIESRNKFKKKFEEICNPVKEYYKKKDPNLSRLSRRNPDDPDNDIGLYGGVITRNLSLNNTFCRLNYKAVDSNAIFWGRNQYQVIISAPDGKSDIDLMGFIMDLEGEGIITSEECDKARNEYAEISSKKLTDASCISFLTGGGKIAK